MREIKFRAWNTRKKWMLGVATLQTLCSCNHYANIEDHIFMQYSDLKDKNAIKICEGDIIKIGLFVCEIIWDLNSLRFKRIDCSTSFNLCHSNNYEIIGNIHENPELLEVAK